MAVICNYDYADEECEVFEGHMSVVANEGDSIGHMKAALLDAIQDSMDKDILLGNDISHVSKIVWLGITMEDAINDGLLGYGVAGAGGSGAGASYGSGEARIVDSGDPLYEDVIIIQDPSTSDPEPNPNGGSIMFTVEEGADPIEEVQSITVIDVGGEGGSIILTDTDGVELDTIEFDADSGAQKIDINAEEVGEITVVFTGVGGVAEVELCHKEKDAESVVPSGSSSNNCPYSPVVLNFDEDGEGNPIADDVEFLPSDTYSNYGIIVTASGGNADASSRGISSDENSRIRTVFAVSIPLLLLLLLAFLFAKRDRRDNNRQALTVGQATALASKSSGQRKVYGTGDPPRSFHEGLYHYTRGGARYLSTRCPHCIETRRQGYYLDDHLHDNDDCLSRDLDTIGEGQLYDPVSGLTRSRSCGDLSMATDSSDSTTGARLVSPNSKDLGGRHSSIDVHNCASATCAICKRRAREITFLSSPEIAQRARSYPAVPVSRMYFPDSVSDDSSDTRSLS